MGGEGREEGEGRGRGEGRYRGREKRGRGEGVDPYPEGPLDGRGPSRSSTTDLKAGLRIEDGELVSCRSKQTI